MKTLFTRLLLAAGAALVLQHACFAQTTPVDTATANRLQNKLEQLLLQHNLKGLSASVIIPGKGTWKGVTGVSHGAVYIDTSMVFNFGSVTKNFTATAILLLQEDGLLSIADSVHEFLPSYPNVNPNITIKQLLQHTSGVANYTVSPSWQAVVNSNPAQVMVADTILTNLIGTPVFAPGTSFQYSNTNFMLLGRIIEEVANMPYHAFVRQRIITPLQLNSLYMDEHEPATAVVPHNWSDPNMDGIGANDIYSNPLTFIFSPNGADGALAGNAHDLALYAQALFSGSLLQPASLTQMATFRPTSGSFNGYGLGLMRYNYQSKPVWGHAGNIAGFAASMFFSTTDSIVVTVLSNQDFISPNLAFPLLGEARASLINATAADLASQTAQLLCFPNPANNSASLRYVLQQPQHVQLTLRNSLGQEIQVIQNQFQQTGEHTLQIETTKFPSGIYFCTLTTDSHSITQRLVVAH